MAGLSGGGDVWRVGLEERAKHDAQFFQLKPVAGLITGEQAKNFFLQSSLPPAILGQIWGLADINADGKMDQKEFSIAMHLIQKKLQGYEIPKVLPAVLKADPVPSPSGVGGFPGMGSLTMGPSPPMGAPPGMGMPPVGMVGAGLGGPGTYATIGPGPTAMSPARMSNGGPMMGGFVPGGSVGFPGPVPGAMPPGSAAQPAAASGGEWAIPQNQKLKYNQMFNMHDRLRRGFLTGMEARAILTQSNLTHTLLAKIWSLADVDNDGKLTTEEFCLAMHLVDMSKSGQPLPDKLPPNLMPPSYRRGRSGSAVGAPPATISPPGAAPGTIPPPTVPSPGGMAQTHDAFGDLLGGLSFGPPPPMQADGSSEQLDASILSPVTFEDRRKENFDKGQAELDRRRQMLLEEQKKMEEERLAAERAEAEKREKKRLEQEMKRQQELDRQMEKQRKLEMEREEQRRKVLEQREAARREMERQRQLEWERQRREQLIMERQREQNQVEEMQSHVSKLKLDLDAMDNKKSELNAKILLARNSVTDFTTSIDGMRVTRDMKMSDIDKFQREVQEWNQKLNMLQSERQQLNIQAQAQNSTLSDTYKTVMHSYSSKQQTIERLKQRLEQIEKDTAKRLEEIDLDNSELNEANNQVNELSTESQRIQGQMSLKQQEWSELKRKREDEDNNKKREEREKHDKLRQELEAQRIKEENEVPTLDSKSENNKFGGWGFDEGFGKSNGSSSQKSSIWGDAFGSSTSSPLAATTTTSVNQDIWSGGFSSQTTTTTTDFLAGWTVEVVETHLLASTPTPSQPLDIPHPSGNGLLGVDQPLLGRSTSSEKELTGLWMKSFDNGGNHMGGKYDAEDSVCNMGTPGPGSVGDVADWKLDVGNNLSFGLASAPASSSGFGSADPFADIDPFGGKSSTDPFGRPDSDPFGGSNPFGGKADAEGAAASTEVKSNDGKGSPSPTGVRTDIGSPGGQKSLGHDTWASAFSSVTSNSASTPSSRQSPMDAFGGRVNSSSQPGGSWADMFSQSSSAGATKTSDAESLYPGYTKYTAMYQFDARNPDEISFTAGDVIWVRPDQTGAEPGWLGGLVEGGSKEGWFPEAYAALASDSNPPAATTNNLPAEVQPAIQEPATHDSISPPEDASSFNAQFSNGSPFPDDDKSQGGSGLLTASEQSSFTAVPTHGPSPTPGQGQSAPEGLQAQAVYPWRAKKENHLSFAKGDIILVKEQQDMWWSGELAGKTGWFPKSYVKLLGTSAANNKSALGTSTPQPEVTLQAPSETSGSLSGSNSAASSPSLTRKADGDYYVAMYNYSSGEQGDLIFSQGDVITVTKTEGEWWSGTVGDRSGMFPANYVKKMETQEISESTDTDLSPKNKSERDMTDGGGGGGKNAIPGQKLTKKPEIASVIAPYQATGAEQLSLQPGQLIQVRKKSPSGWWEGELQARGQKRKIGWFPANYVKLLGSTSARSTPDPTRGSSSSSPMKSLSPTPQPNEEGRTETPVPTYPQPTHAPALEQVVALFTYAAQNEDELTFEKDSVINVVSKDDDNWWRGELNGITGMFPSNYVTPLNAANESESWPNGYAIGISSGIATTPTEKKRQSRIAELIDTEETYMKDISLVLETFHRPLGQEKVLTEQELQAIFVNWKELMMCNIKLLKALRVRKKMSRPDNIHMIGDLLCENLPHMTPYIRFCSCQLNAAALIQRKTENDPRFKEVAQKCCRDPRTQGLPLSSFLLKPMQRITKYPLLIEKILEHTPPEHPDHQNLQDALAKANEICNQVNEGVREKENSDRLEWIQTHVQCDGLTEKIPFNSVTNCLGPRKFMHSGTLYKAKSGKELIGFLFNDFLLLTQPQRPQSGVSVFSFDTKASALYKMYRQPIFLNEVLLKKSSEPDTDSTLFYLNHIDRRYSLKAVSTSERDAWVKKIESASKLYLETERKKRERAHSYRNELRSCSVGRLLVVIVEGCDLSMREERSDKRVMSKGCGRLMVIVLEGCCLKASDEIVRRAPAVGRLLVVIVEGINLTQGEDGKSDPYCEVSMGAQEQKTRVINNTLNPKWNASMQFTIKDPQEDVLCITVYDRDLFTPNDFLGRTEIRVYDIMTETRETKGPIMKRLLLHEVESGEVVVKLDLQLYEET